MYKIGDEREIYLKKNPLKSFGKVTFDNVYIQNKEEYENDAITATPL